MPITEARSNRLRRLAGLAVTVAVVLLAAQTPAFAQGGCVDSPENSTLILALIGAGVGLWLAVRAWLGKKRKTHHKPLAS